jgi:hypothetical protein
MATIMTPLVVFMFMIQNEKTHGSFPLYRTLPVGCHTLFWSRVLSCWLLSAVCVSLLYLFYILYLALGLISRDALTPVLLGFPYILLLLSLSIFSSACSVALAFNISPQLLPTIVTVISAIVVVVPLIFSSRVAGIDGQEALANYFARYGVFGGFSLALLSFSLLIGGLGSWAFRLKRAYV